MIKYYIINDGHLDGYVYSAYANMHNDTGQLLTEVAWVNVETGVATHVEPTGDGWLKVDDTYSPGKVATLSGWVDVEPATPHPVITVAAWAAKSALARAGLATKVDQAVAAVKTTDYELYYKWHGATTFKSTDPDLVKMAFKLNMSQTDLQNLFVAAKAIEASSS